MAEGIFHTYLVLMAIITLNQLLPSSDKTISPEDEEEMVQRMKEREVILWQHQLHLEKETEDLEARQASLAWPLWELERKIQWHTCTVFCLVVPVVFMIWRQRWNGGTWEHREEETELGLLRKAWRGVVFLTKLCVLFRAICSVVPLVFMIWGQRWNGGTWEHREEETELGLLGKAWRGVVFLTKLSVLLRAICSVVPVVFMICRQRWNGGTWKHREEETELGLLRKAWRGVVFLTELSVLFRAICSVVPVVFMIWGQRWNGGTWKHREEETELGLLGKAWRGVVFLTELSVLFRAVCSVVPVVLMICRQRWNGGTWEHREEETELGLLGKALKRAVLLTESSVLFRTIFNFVGRIIHYFELFADRLLELPLKLLRS